MTINEAEQQYTFEVEKCIEQHKKQLQKSKRFGLIFNSVLIVIGIVLTVIGFTAPLEVSYGGYESRSTAAILEILFGIWSLSFGVIFVLLTLLFSHKLQKQGPKNFLPQIKHLYFNYLKCEDMSRDDKEFYIQKLEDIRNMELVDAIHRASATASAAIMFNALHK